MLVAVSALTCGQGPTAEDRARLEKLEETYGDRYRFRFTSDDVYLEARQTTSGVPREEEVSAIYRDFWLSGSRPRQDSRYLYLNIYDRNGDFLFQLYWSPQRQEPVRSLTSHY